METVLLFFLASMFTVTTPHYTKVNNKLHQVVYLYPNQIRDDKDLDVCDEGRGRVCGMVHKRYWLPPLVYRECTCPKGTSSCSYKWSDYSDNLSVPLNNMAQLKVCRELNGEDKETSMPVCAERQMGLSVEEVRYSLGGQSDRNITVHCQCKWPAYWQLGVHVHNTTYTYNTYYCNKLKICQLGDFCGHIRADTHSVYYRCRCPANSVCINSDRTERRAFEVLYEGPTYRAYCQQVETKQQP